MVIRVLPVDGAASSPFLGARALLTLSDLDPKPAPLPDLLANAFRLTPAEAKLTCVIGNGGSLEHAAGELRLSRETVRNQLKAVFAKTDTHRQSELVALLARL
jgi:DNA-binding CsgD family transcriptional regulator